jgi:integrase
LTVNLTANRHSEVHLYRFWRWLEWSGVSADWAGCINGATVAGKAEFVFGADGAGRSTREPAEMSSDGSVKPAGHSARGWASVLGDIPLRNLTPGLIQSAYAGLLEAGLSKRTVEQTHAVLHRALDQAMHWGLTSRNPAELVAAPRSPRREMTALSGDQLQELLRVTTGSQWHPLWVLLSTSGLRLGEALGLHWQDIDVAGRRLAVRCALQQQRGRGLVLVPPKTPRSRRTIYLSELARRALEDQLQRQDQRRRTTGRWIESGLVFTNRIGAGLEQGVVNRALHQALAQAGLPRIRVHDLRHTTASILLAAGTHPKLVQDLLGHSTVTLTLDTYSHLTEPLHEQAARTMDLVLASPTPVDLAAKLQL